MKNEFQLLQVQWNLLGKEFSGFHITLQKCLDNVTNSAILVSGGVTNLYLMEFLNMRWMLQVLLLLLSNILDLAPDLFIRDITLI